MRHLFFVPLTAILLMCMHAAYSKMIYKESMFAADTSITIHHKQDGIINEWPSAVFQTDVGTDISYAIDNDSTNLYLVLNVPNQGIQLKLMRIGMNLYLDPKGKRKESRGIAFPVKDESDMPGNAATPNAGETDNEPAPNGTTQAQRQSNIRIMRASLALRLNYMNVFGFHGIEKHDQGLQMPGSINISFGWDSADVMHIEYSIPLNMVDDIASLKNKEIGIGWKINGIYPSDRPAGRRPHQQSSAGYGQHQTNFDPNAKRMNHETIIREQNIWTKYQVE